VTVGTDEGIDVGVGLRIEGERVEILDEGIEVADKGIVAASGRRGAWRWV